MCGLVRGNIPVDLVERACKVVIFPAPPSLLCLLITFDMLRILVFRVGLVHIVVGGNAFSMVSRVLKGF